MDLDDIHEFLSARELPWCGLPGCTADHFAEGEDYLWQPRPGVEEAISKLELGENVTLMVEGAKSISDEEVQLKLCEILFACAATNGYKFGSNDISDAYGLADVPEDATGQKFYPIKYWVDSYSDLFESGWHTAAKHDAIDEGPYSYYEINSFKMYGSVLINVTRQASVRYHESTHGMLTKSTD